VTHRCHAGAVVYSTTRRLVGVARRCSSSSHHHHHHHHHHRITLSSSSSRVAAVSRRPCVCTGWTSWSASWSVLSGSAIVDTARCSSTSRPPISRAAEKAYVYVEHSLQSVAVSCSALQRFSFNSAIHDVAILESRYLVMTQNGSLNRNGRLPFWISSTKFLTAGPST